MMSEIGPGVGRIREESLFHKQDEALLFLQASQASQLDIFR